MNQALIEYIGAARRAGMNDLSIQSELLKAGWGQDLIQQSLGVAHESKGAVLNVVKLGIPVKIVLASILIVLLGVSAYVVYFYKIQRIAFAPPQFVPVVNTNTGVAETVAVKDILETPQAPYVVAVSGTISKDGTVVLEPFFFTPTSLTKLEDVEGDGEGQFTLEFFKDSRSIAQSTIDAYTCADVPGDDTCFYADHSAGMFVAAVLVPDMPDKLVIRKNDQTLFTKETPATPFPAIEITSQELKDNVLHITWRQEPTDTKLDYLAKISNNEFSDRFDESKQTITAFNRLGFATITPLPDGTTKPIVGVNEVIFNTRANGGMEGTIQTMVYVTDGFRTRVFHAQDFTTTVYPVRALIREPEEGKSYEQNYVSLEVNKFDTTGNYAGPAYGTTYTWTSDKDGMLATGERAHCQNMTPGDHTITLTAENTNGTKDSVSVRMKVTTDTFFWNNPSQCDDPANRGSMTKEQCISYYATVKYESEKATKENQEKGRYCY